MTEWWETLSLGPKRVLGTVTEWWETLSLGPKRVLGTVTEWWETMISFQFWQEELHQARNGIGSRCWPVVRHAKTYFLHNLRIDTLSKISCEKSIIDNWRWKPELIKLLHFKYYRNASSKSGQLFHYIFSHNRNRFSLLLHKWAGNLLSNNVNP